MYGAGNPKQKNEIGVEYRCKSQKKESASTSTLTLQFRKGDTLPHLQTNAVGARRTYWCWQCSDPDPLPF
jgi:hypothetical protein